ncbi:hypothetical protein Nstercoris_01255 [Nitrosomonas stercoris]|uniref:Uncharacterized protein n=1 Tax=Nitrosomonas stercoris TaxID=1444684 RepID=A0A4Y1YPQ4_9PROT|nr:hypothetical protein Nstercoris_01255 [Nitrosomonas stercoris]
MYDQLLVMEIDYINKINNLYNQWLVDLLFGNGDTRHAGMR